MGWADRKLAEIAKKKEDDRLRDEHFARENAQKLAEAPGLWDRLGDELKQEVARYNEGEGIPTQLSVTDVVSEVDTSCKMLTSKDVEVIMTFHRKVPQITYKVKKSVGPYEMKAEADSGMFFFEILKGEVWLRHKGRGGVGGINDGSCDVPSAAGILLDLVA